MGHQIWLVFDGSFADRQNDKLQIYNLSQIGTDRKWLQDILLSDTETDADEHSDEDEYIREMLKNHVKEKNIRAKYYQNPHVSVESSRVELSGMCDVRCVRRIRAWINFNIFHISID